MNKILFALLLLGKFSPALGCQAALAASGLQQGGRAAPPPPAPQPPAASASQVSHRLAEHRVHVLRCNECTRPLTKRAMNAVIYADPKTTRYCSKQLSVFLLPGRPDKSKLCGCKTQTLTCLCGVVVGYSVLESCDECSKSDYNGHCFRFFPEDVMATELTTLGVEGEGAGKRFLTFGDMEKGLWPDDFDFDGGDPASGGPASGDHDHDHEKGR